MRSGGDERASGPACRGGPVEAGGSPIPGTGVRAGSGPDNDGTHQILPDGAGPASETERHTKRNQWLKAPQANSHQPGIWRMGVGSHRAPGRRCTGGRGTPGSEDVAGREAVTYVRGAVTAKVQGHNWVPIPSTDHMVNVGTPLPVPARVRRPAVRGRTGSSPTGAGGGGRRTRSSPGPGEPVAWRRGPARVRGNREHGGGDTLVNTGVPWPADVKGAWHRVLVTADEAAPMGGGRVRPPLRVTRFNLVYDPAFLVVAWDRVRSNRGGRTAGAGRGRPPRRAGAAHARCPICAEG